MPTRAATRRPTGKRSETLLGRPPKRNRRKSRMLETMPLLSHLRVQGAWDRQRLVCFVLLLGLGWLLLQCFIAPDFVVHAPTVSGNKGLPTNEIVEATRGVQGKNIFLIDSQEVRQIVLRFPGVKEAQIRLELPNRLTIEINDQEPQIIWVAQGVRYLIDNNGQVIKPAGAVDRSLVITDPDPQAAPLKANQQMDRRAIRTVQQLDKLMPRQIKSYEWSLNGGITIVGNEDWRAAIGWDENLETKVELVRAALKRAAERREPVKWIDVRAPERPFTK